MQQVGEALDAAHAAGLVHRDVKPGNILVAAGPDGEQAYVCDFGLARHVSSVGSLTGDRGFVGTVDYVAPEQIRGETVDGRADVYALGCVLFECLAGERPFERESELAVVFAHLNEPPPRLTELRPELPAAWDGVVARALAKEPDARYADVRRARRRGERRAARARGADGAVSLAARRRGARPRLAVAAAAVGAVLAAPRRRRRRRSQSAQRPLVLDAVDASIGTSAREHPLGHAVRLRARHPPDVVVAGRSAWLLLPSEQRLLRVDTRTHRADERRSGCRGSRSARLAAGDGFVWAAQDGGPELARISTATGRLDRFRPGDVAVDGAHGRRRLAVGRDRGR